MGIFEFVNNVIGAGPAFFAAIAIPAALAIFGSLDSVLSKN